MNRNVQIGVAVAVAGLSAWQRPSAYWINAKYLQRLGQFFPVANGDSNGVSGRYRNYLILLDYRLPLPLRRYAPSWRGLTLN